jgi:hypothetical protein
VSSFYAWRGQWDALTRLLELGSAPPSPARLGGRLQGGESLARRYSSFNTTVELALRAARLRKMAFAALASSPPWLLSRTTPRDSLAPNTAPPTALAPGLATLRKELAESIGLKCVGLCEWVSGSMLIGSTRDHADADADDDEDEDPEPALTGWSTPTALGFPGASSIAPGASRRRKK